MEDGSTARDEGVDEMFQELRKNVAAVLVAICLLAIATPITASEPNRSSADRAGGKARIATAVEQIVEPLSRMARLVERMMDRGDRRASARDRSARDHQTSKAQVLPDPNGTP